MKTSQLRIIGGKYRGRKLTFSEHAGLRPTSDRTRETLFNWLMHDVHDAVCLDLFAGSGALGFEAISRGAKQVAMVEKAKTVSQQLKDNSIKLGVEKQVNIITADAIDWLKCNEQRFDLVFLDPPFRKNLLAPCLCLLRERVLLNPGAYVYIEFEADLEPDLSVWEVLHLKNAGQTKYGLLGLASSAPTYLAGLRSQAC